MPRYFSGTTALLTLSTASVSDLLHPPRARPSRPPGFIGWPLGHDFNIPGWMV